MDSTRDRPIPSGGRLSWATTTCRHTEVHPANIPKPIPLTTSGTAAAPTIATRSLRGRRYAPMTSTGIRKKPATIFTAIAVPTSRPTATRVRRVGDAVPNQSDAVRRTARLTNGSWSTAASTWTTVAVVA